MDSTLVAETSGFAAIAGGLGSAAALLGAIDGLGHRRGELVAVTTIAGRENRHREYVGCRCDARRSLGVDPLQAPRALLVVGERPSAGRPPGCIARGLVDGQAVAACLVGTFHNGPALRDALVQRGALVQSGGDAELLLHLMAQSRQRTLVNRLVEALERIVGGYSLALISDELAVAARDPRGFRPLWLGACAEGHVVSTDPGALEDLGADELRELAAGEVALLEPGAPVRSLRPWGSYPRAACAMEWLALGRLSGSFDGLSAYAVRHRLGLALAAASPAPVELVACLPGGCSAAAAAFARQAALPLEVVFEHSGPAWQGTPRPLPLRPVTAAVRGRRLALVVGPETGQERLRDAVEQLRNAGATQVHLRSVAPLRTGGCPYGIRLSSPGFSHTAELEIAALRAWLRVDSLEATSQTALATAIGREGVGSCAHCLGGAAPLVARDAAATPQLPLFDGGDPGIDEPRLV